MRKFSHHFVNKVPKHISRKHAFGCREQQQMHGLLVNPWRLIGWATGLLGAAAVGTGSNGGGRAGPSVPQQPPQNGQPSKHPTRNRLQCGPTPSQKPDRYLLQLPCASSASEPTQTLAPTIGQQLDTSQVASDRAFFSRESRRACSPVRITAVGVSNQHSLHRSPANNRNAASQPGFRFLTTTRRIHNAAAMAHQFLTTVFVSLPLISKPHKSLQWHPSSVT
jgi:hypothetical protein